MCGFAGFCWTAPDAPRDAAMLEALVGRMADTLRHRGPDDRGTWSDPSAGVAFGFRRLAIVDLSDAGHQPMRSASGRYTLVFNGEIYNFLDLRRALGGDAVPWRGGSDTEVVLAAFEAWGIDATLPRLAGMFAMAIWDSQRRVLTLVRDRLGIKPLYVLSRPECLVFGSELRALEAGPRSTGDLDPTAAATLLRHLFIPDPICIRSGVRKLRPGWRLDVDADGGAPRERAWWSLAEVAAAGMAAPLPDDETALDGLETLLGDVIAEHLLADVPLGAFLSGGVDSSLVTALAQRRSAQPLQTYCVQFDDPTHDEAAHAAAVARHLGTRHTTIPVSGADALALVPELPDLYDEPFADTSQIPMALLCRVARRHVTVALSGEGGDEFFGGYNRYAAGTIWSARAARLPTALRRAAAGGAHLLSADAWDDVAGVARRLPGSGSIPRLPGAKMRKLGELLRAGDDATRYAALIAVGVHGWRLDSGGANPDDELLRAFGLLPSAPLASRQMFSDQLVYLPGDPLTKADRASMAASLELRVPLVDHRVVEASWRHPASQHLQGGVTKYLLRRLLHRHVPPALVDRPKVGFSVPLAEWLRGPLREFAADHLHARHTATAPLLAPRRVAAAWTRFARHGHSELAPTLWAAVMLQAWAGRSASREATG